MLYRSHSIVTKTFYGVTFKPGEIHKVPGYINDKDFERVHGLPPMEPPARVDSSTKSTSSKPATSSNKPTQDTSKKENKPAESAKKEELKQTENKNKEEKT